MVSFKTNDNKILKGFSQIDLDRLNYLLRILIIISVSFSSIIIGILVWCLWQIKKYGKVTHLINALK